MTLGDAIREAHVEMLQAEQRRDHLLAHARARGVSVTELGELLGVSRETAWRWSGGKLGKRGSSSPLLADLAPGTARPDGTILLENTEFAPGAACNDPGAGPEPHGGPERA